MAEAEVGLVQKAQRGDRASFEELVRRTSRLVLARLYLETGRLDEAEDLLQETFLTAFRTLDRLQDPARFRSWLLQIAHNKAIDQARHGLRLKRRADTSGQIEDLESRGPSPSELAERRELQERALSVLRRLPDEYRLPLALRYLVGADYDAIQAQMGLTNGSLRGLLHRGMKMLRAELESLQSCVPGAPGQD